jgi:hypothetical protein
MHKQQTAALAWSSSAVNLPLAILRADFPPDPLLPQPASAPEPNPTRFSSPLPPSPLRRKLNKAKTGVTLTTTLRIGIGMSGPDTRITNGWRNGYPALAK